MKYFSILLFCFIIVFVAVVHCIPVPQDDYLFLDIEFENENPEIICRQHQKRGNCRALIPRWVYDPKKGICHEFKYGGCGGNGNNFRTRKECERHCHGIKV